MPEHEHHGGHHEHPVGSPASFDERAATWEDSSDHVLRATEVGAAIRAAVPIQPTWRVMDFGAGTGLLGRALAPAAAVVDLVDMSAGMIDEARRIVARDPALDGKVRAHHIDVVTEPCPGAPFDLIVSLLALHHVEDVPEVLGTLTGLLVPGGWLALADLDAEDGSFHGEAFGGHRGFERDRFAGWLSDAGLRDVRFTTAAYVEHDTDAGARAYPVFLATARAVGALEG